MIFVCADGCCKQQKLKPWAPVAVLQEGPNRQLEQHQAAGNALQIIH